MAKRDIDEIEEVDEEEVSGGGLETGLIVATFVALVIGIVIGFKELGAHYGVGPFAG